MASVYGFTGPGDEVVWVVEVPVAGEYEVAVIYRTTEAGSLVEVGANGRRLTVRTVNTAPVENRQLNCRRERLSGTLPLAAGRNEIKLRLLELPDNQVELARKELQAGGWGGIQYKGAEPCSFRLWSVELVRPEARRAIEQRAAGLRADSGWMVDGKYGLFIHWSPLPVPLKGPKLAYQAATELFDVGAFCDMVEETGAKWLFFTTTHGTHHFPGPIEAIDRIMPSLTCERDLVAEIAADLEQRGIRLCLYYHMGTHDPEWRGAVGYTHPDKSHWFNNICAIAEEINSRYGRRVWGWFIDDAHKYYYPCDFPWERFVRALKTSNPNRLIALNPGTRPSLTPFGDLLASDNGRNLRPVMDHTFFQEDGQYSNLQQHYSFTLEPGWVLKDQPNGGIPDPAHSTDDLIEYVRSCAAASVPVTINTLITQNVTRHQPLINPQSLHLMRELRRTIRDP